MKIQLAAAALLLAVTHVAAQTVSGQAFDDRNGNGLKDPGEPALPAVSVEVFGRQTGNVAYDQTTATAADGGYSLAPGNGCFLINPADPAGWRGSFTRFDVTPDNIPGYTEPIGYPRFSKADKTIAGLKTGSYRYTAMGDSISANFNLCGSSSFWYAQQIRARLECVLGVSPGTVALDQAGVSGEHTDDLLVPETNNNNNIFQVIAMSPQPKLVTISMIGNDLRNVDITGVPSQAQINRAVEEVLDSRQNLQEAISVLTSQLPNADVALNTLYDNLAHTCYSTDSTPFHRAWLPIINRMLRDLAWGQIRRASINEVAAEFAREDQNVVCTGFDGRICQGLFNLDRIHPDVDGYTIVREKVWEALGGFHLGVDVDPIDRTSIGSANFGFIKRLRRLLPTTTQVQNGAVAANATAAASDTDGGATASITLGRGTEEFRATGFPDWYDEDQGVKVLAGVRYRTSGTVTDDFYRIEASPTGTFRAPAGYAYTNTNWNFYTPIVGAGGPNAPVSNDYPDAKILVLPNVASLREASATLTKNPTLPPGAGEYDWPALTHNDLATTAIRVVSAPVANTVGDAYAVELDAAWLDVYGWQKPRPGEVQNLAIGRLIDGTLELSFDSLPSAQRYNLYVGRLATVRAGSYDHGASAPIAPLCAATHTDVGVGRRKIALSTGLQPGESAYFLVTAHVDDVESPTGTGNGGVEIDRSQSICE
jgi:lysophospholipase L1-like esterase